MNRGGLQGAAFELDDRFTAYDVPTLLRLRFDGGKMLTRIDLADPGTVRTLEQLRAPPSPSWPRPGCPPWSSRSCPPGEGDRVVNDLTAAGVAKSVGIASALGATSAYTWLKLPVVDDMERVMAATTLPTLLLGGDPTTSPDETYAAWAKALALPGVRGLVVGRALLYPGRRRRRGRRRHGRGPGGGQLMAGDDCHRTAGSTGTAPFTVDISAGRGRLGLQRAAGPAAGRRCPATHRDRRQRDARAAAGRLGHRRLRGRADRAGRSRRVWSGPTDFAYLPTGATATLVSAGGGRFALPSARTERRLPVRYGRRSTDVPVELRGAGVCSRQVNNFCTPETFEAAALIACEVLTPGRQLVVVPAAQARRARAWTATLVEAELEEIYYFEVVGAGTAWPTNGSTAPPDRPIDVLAEVRTGDVVLIPHGWHGPSMARPGYDLYYLNVMAGPGAERAWLICDDPAHGWVRETWADQAVDPRLPFGDAAGVTA